MNNQWADLKIRMASAMFLAALVCFATWYHLHSFTMLLLIGGYILGREWQRLNIARDIVFSIVGYGYIVGSVFSLYWLRSSPLPLDPEASVSPVYVWVLFAIVWGTDIGGYLMGRMLGGRKLWPAVSPNKTCSGAVGGAVVACAAAGIATLLLPVALPVSVLLLIALVTSVVSQLGDMFESHLKRRAGVKDSGKLIPGHGGLFDRVDGLMAASPVYAIMLGLV